MAKKTKKKAAARRRRSSAKSRRRPSTSGARRSPSPRKPSKKAINKVATHQAVGSAMAIGTRVALDHAVDKDGVKGANRNGIDAAQGGGGLLVAAAGWVMDSPMALAVGAHQVTSAASSYSTRKRCERVQGKVNPSNDGVSLFQDGLQASGLSAAEAETLVADLASPETAGPLGLVKLIKSALHRLQQGGGLQAEAAQDIALAAAGQCYLDGEGYGCTDTGRLRDRFKRFGNLVRARKNRRQTNRYGRQELKHQGKLANIENTTMQLPEGSSYGGSESSNDPQADAMLRELEALVT